MDLYSQNNLFAHYNRDIVQEALYIASPVLYNAFIKYKNGAMQQPREIRKVTTALWQYLIRMSTRCTPFGIFSGCAVGSFGSETLLELPAVRDIRRHMRLDMDYLCRVADFVAGHHSLRTQLRYYPNSSLYRYARQWRYARYDYQGDIRVYNLVKAEMTPVLNKVIKAAAGGRTFSELTTVVTAYDVTAEEAAGYLLQLIDAQILKSDLEASTSGEEFTQTLVNKLQQYQGTAPLVKVLADIQQQMRQINDTPGIDVYRQIKEQLSALPVPMDESRLFQVDTIKQVVHNQLSSTVANDVKEALFIVARLNNEQHRNTKLEEFKRAFEERYGTQTVPLATALDVENGIGYQQALDTADSYKRRKPGRTADLDHDPRSAFLFEKYRQALADGSEEIIISQEETERFPLDPAILPDAIDTVFSLYKGDTEEQPLIRFIGASPPATRLLARFCHADTTLAQKVKQLVQEEEALHPDKVYAEVLHLPQAQVGNILARPHLRKYEIPYLCRSTLPPRQQLPLNDLYLQLQEGQLLLLSKRLEKEVMPQLTAAHNFVHDSLPVYQFLSSLSLQGKCANLMWDWAFLSMEPFLPRVRYKNVILKPATWNIRSTQLANLTADGFARVKEALRLPGQVLLVEGDNELLLDLTTPMGIQLLLDAARQQPNIVLNECLATADNLLVKSAAGYLTNEIIIPFVRQAVSTTPAIAPQRRLIHADRQVERYFPPGTEWMYYKIYVGEHTADGIIRDILYPFAQKMLKQQVIDKWFFIRYQDPHHHIRVRYHLRDVNDPLLLHAFKDAIFPAFQQRLISRLQMDTYERELERYGAGTIALSESLFHIHSDCISMLLIQMHREGSKQHRNMAGLLWIDSIMSALHYTPGEKADFYRRNFESFTAEFNYHGNKGQREGLNESYRANTALIAEYLQHKVEEQRIPAIIKGYIPHAASLISSIRQLFEVNGQHYDYALRSYLHMFMNSLMPARQRWEEFQVYFYLLRYYTSQLARLTKKVNTDGIKVH
jgi:thiopeptide-type bacteriocin biosynthesis protein